MSNLNDVLIFVQVVERGSLSAAARVLKMSPSHVSRRLRSLEESVGTQLISRSTRYISLTGEGEVFYKKCAPALAVLNSAHADLAGVTDEPRGTLKIHSSVGIGQGLVSQAATDFQIAYPNVMVDLYIDSHRENVIRDGYDLIIKTSDIPDSSLIRHDLKPLRYMVVASTDYFQRIGRPRTPHDLVGHNCLLQYRWRPSGEWRFTGPDGDYCVKVAGGFRSTSAVALCVAAEAGIGIARLPEYVLYGKKLEDRKLETIFDDCVADERPLKVFYPRSQHPPAKIKLFLEFLKRASAG